MADFELDDDILIVQWMRFILLHNVDFFVELVFITWIIFVYQEKGKKKA